MTTKWIIEARTPDGALDFTGPDPSSVFGPGAIHGLTENAMAKMIFARVPDATLRGDSIASWPSLIDARWRARPKTW